MPSMMVGAANFEEEFTNMKVMLERLSKESVEKDVRIKRQEEHIAKLLKKLDKGHVRRPTKAQAVTRMKKGPIKPRLLRMVAGQRRATSHKMTHL